MKAKAIKKKKDFLKTLKTGRRLFSSSMTLVALPAKETRFAVCVGKKHGKSVQRNHIKRLLREAFYCHRELLSSSYFLLLIPKVKSEYSFHAFERELKRLFLRLNGD